MPGTASTYPTAAYYTIWVLVLTTHFIARRENANDFWGKGLLGQQNLYFCYNRPLSGEQMCSILILKNIYLIVN